MEQARLTGPQSGSLKYDLLTALSVMGLHGSTTLQSSVLRLCALVTARYNWKRDELSIGQAEMARLWNVNERTVKREVKRLVDGGLLVVKRPGVRGRVASYRLNYPAIYQLSKGSWEAVGGDFYERMARFDAGPATNVVKVDFETRRTEPASSDGGAWSGVLGRLAAEDADTARNWYSKLTLEGREGSTVTVRAPGKFVAQFVQAHLSRPLSQAIAAELGPFERLEITC
ncbi:hypothetical protein AB1M95_19875 (plasmid) [Sulfitobacter sp. LCG007]